MQSVQSPFQDSNEVQMTCCGAFFVVNAGLLKPCCTAFSGANGTLSNTHDAFWYFELYSLRSRNSMSLRKKLMGRDFILSHRRSRLYAARRLFALFGGFPGFLSSSAF